eukprot:scaffold2581_cov164-Pinguiococcus_pyrenoidosus.AAC.3
MVSASCSSRATADELALPRYQKSTRASPTMLCAMEWLLEATELSRKRAGQCPRAFHAEDSIEQRPSTRIFVPMCPSDDVFCLWLGDSPVAVQPLAMAPKTALIGSALMSCLRRQRSRAFASQISGGRFLMAPFLSVASVTCCWGSWKLLTLRFK